MERKEIFDLIRKAISEQVEIPEEEIKWESRFVEDLGADSLDLVEMIMALEEEIGKEVPDEEAEKIRTIGQAVELIESLLQ